MRKLFVIISIFALSFGWTGEALAYSSKLKTVGETKLKTTPTNVSYSGFSFDTAASGNADPYGISCNNTYCFTTDQTDDEVYQYYKSNGNIFTSFDLAGNGNTDAYGIYCDNTHCYVTDGSDAQVYQYLLNGTPTGFSFDTNASGNGSPRGIACDGTYCYVTDSIDSEIYRYYQRSGVYTSWSFDTAGSGNTSLKGLSCGNKYCYTTDDTDDLVYQFEKNRGIFTGFSFSLVSSGNTAPYGIACDNMNCHVVDTTDDLVYQYQILGMTKIHDKQLLTDGDMERTVVTGYWGAGNGAVLSKRPGGAKGGNRILRITSGGSAAGNAYYLGTIVGGQRYHVSGYARGDGTNHPRVYIATSVPCWTGTTSTAWQHFDCVFSGTTGYPLRLIAFSATAGTFVEFDQLYFTEY